MSDKNEAEEESVHISKETTIQRLKEFTYYLTQNVENNLNFCLTYLEGRVTIKKPNSTAVTAVSTIATPIPYVGKGISSAIKEGEMFILNKIDEKNSKTLANLVYFYNDNKEKVRQMLIEAAFDVFFCFERQFVKVTCEGGPRRAMQKLGRDAANRIFSYFLKTKQNGSVTRDEFGKGVLLGESLKDKFGVATGKTVQSEEQQWKTASIYTKVGVFHEETNEFFSGEETNSLKYGYRRMFEWEDVETFREKWTLDTSCQYSYILTKDLSQLLPEIKEYIMTKSLAEEATLDRTKKHETLLQDHEDKHQEIMSTFLEKFGQVLSDLTRNYSEILVNRQESATVVSTIKEQQYREEERHQEVTSILTEIHGGVVETRETQVRLEHKSENIQNEICVIKTKQEELYGATSEVQKSLQQVSNQKNPKLSDLVCDNYEVKKVTKIVQEVVERVKNNDVEPRVRKEIQRGLKKIFK